MHQSFRARFNMLKFIFLKRYKFFSITIIASSIGLSIYANPEFPLKLSTSKRYLVDQNNKPFLIKEISAWGLIQSLSEADESSFMDSVKNKGFNTMMVSIISFDTRFAGHPPDWQGIPPFKKHWDFSTYNLAYFEHADHFLVMAREKGMLVLLVPCYPGYKGDSSQGWGDELLSAQNNPAKSLQYGKFLGGHYKNCNNIIWVAGGDNSSSGALYDHMNNIIKGIKQFDSKHLWTGHFESAQGTNWPSGNSLYASYINIDGLYDFTESALGKDAPQYKTELLQYEHGKLIFQLDQSYEHDIPHAPDNEDYQWIRRKNYDGLLSGCAGTSFSPGQPGNQCYTFANWRPLMNTIGMKEIFYCFKAFETLKWYDLIPDRGDSIIIHGRGSFGSIDYACAAITSDNHTFIAYLPTARTLTIDMGKLAGTKADAIWYNPRSGETSLMGSITVKGMMDFTPVANGDWLLIIENTSMPSH